MPTQRKYVLVALLSVLLINIIVLILGALLGHNGLFAFGAEVGKVVFGTVVGALASAFSEK